MKDTFYVLKYDVICTKSFKSFKKKNETPPLYLKHPSSLPLTRTRFSIIRGGGAARPSRGDAAGLAGGRISTCESTRQPGSS